MVYLDAPGHSLGGVESSLAAPTEAAGTPAGRRTALPGLRDFGGSRVVGAFIARAPVGRGRGSGARAVSSRLALRLFYPADRGVRHRPLHPGDPHDGNLFI